MTINTSKLRPYKSSSIPTIEGGLNTFLAKELQAISAASVQEVVILTAAASEADANTAAIVTNTSNIATNTSNITANTTAITTMAGSVTALQAKTTGYEAAWTPYTPTITALVGTFTSTSASGAYLVIGKLVHFTVTIIITTVGSASSAVVMTLPVGTAKRPFVLSGMETTATGKALHGVTTSAGSSTSQVGFYDNTFPGASGNVLTLTGVYEQT